MGTMSSAIDSSMLEHRAQLLARDLLDDSQLMELVSSLLDTMVALAVGVELVVVGLLIRRWLR